MELEIEKPKNRFKALKILLAIVIAVSIGGGIIWLNKTTKQSQVKRSDVIISQVSEGDLLVEVRGAGSLQPTLKYWISAKTKATLDRLHVKAGAVVKKGQLLMTFSDLDLDISLRNMEWQIKFQKATINAKQKSLEANIVERQLEAKKAELEKVKKEKELVLQRLEQKNSGM